MLRTIKRIPVKVTANMWYSDKPFEWAGRRRDFFDINGFLPEGNTRISRQPPANWA